MRRTGPWNVMDFPSINIQEGQKWPRTCTQHPGHVAPWRPIAPDAPLPLHPCQPQPPHRHPPRTRRTAGRHCRHTVPLRQRPNKDKATVSRNPASQQPPLQSCRRPRLLLPPQSTAAASPHQRPYQAVNHVHLHLSSGACQCHSTAGAAAWKKAQQSSLEPLPRNSDFHLHQSLVLLATLVWPPCSPASGSLPLELRRQAATQFPHHCARLVQLQLPRSPAVLVGRQPSVTNLRALPCWLQAQASGPRIPPAPWCWSLARHRGVGCAIGCLQVTLVHSRFHSRCTARPNQPGHCMET